MQGSGLPVLGQPNERIARVEANLVGQKSRETGTVEKPLHNLDATGELTLPRVQVKDFDHGCCRRCFTGALDAQEGIKRQDTRLSRYSVLGATRSRTCLLLSRKVVHKGIKQCSSEKGPLIGGLDSIIQKGSQIFIADYPFRLGTETMPGRQIPCPLANFASLGRG